MIGKINEFFFFKNIIEGYSTRKWKIKKAKKYNQVNKEKLQKRTQEYYKYLSEDEKINKRSYVNIRNKKMSDVDRERKK